MSQKDYNNIEDFLIDDTFQKYCSGENNSCIQYWEQYIVNHPEQLETIQHAKRLYQVLVGNKPAVNERLEHMKARLKEEKNELSIFSWHLSHLFRIAAVLALFGFAYFWYTQFYSKRIEPLDQFVAAQIFETKKGEKKTFDLPDGTTITLNSDSKLELDKDFNDHARHVYLTGEGFFEVKKDKEKPFVVYANDFDISVLGTTFNVKSYPNDGTSEAFLVEGLIEMRSKGINENSMIIKPNQKIILYKNQFIEAKKDPAVKKEALKSNVKEIKIQDFSVDEPAVSSKEIAWKDNRLEIMDQDFESLRHTLERWYDVDIEIKNRNLEDYRFTATFSKENINQVLNALQKVEPFNYEIYGRKITIY